MNGAATAVTIAATAAMTVAMIVATAVMTARTAAVDLGCYGDSSMGGLTMDPMSSSPLSRVARVHGSVTS